MRQHTIGLDEYGDGLTDDERRTMSEAEADAIRQRYPGATVRIETATMHDGDDPEITEWAGRVWDDILGAWPFNGGPDADTIVKAWREVFP